MSYNIAVQRSLSPNLSWTLRYVGANARNIAVITNLNSAKALVNPSLDVRPFEPFPSFASADITDYLGKSNYNSLQTTVQKRYGNGLSFLATYTWAHSLDDAPDAFGSNADGGFRNINLLPIEDDYSNSAFDVRNRVTFNGMYELPFGAGHRYLNSAGMSNRVVGGWRMSLTFTDQSGPPISVSPNIATAGGGKAFAVKLRDPFSSGGSAGPSNPGVACAAHTKTTKNWYNPCSFANPLSGTSISRGSAGPNPVPPQTVTDPSEVLRYLGGRRNEIAGPGFERVNMSIFKDFQTIREQRAEFRADIFNVLNTPSYGDPSVSNINSNGGEITGPQFFQANTPDARFFQLSLKYIF